MARNNYSWAKRQKELAKKKKQEEKRQRRLERKQAAQQSRDKDAVTAAEEQGE